MTDTLTRRRLLAGVGAAGLGACAPRVPAIVRQQDGSDVLRTEDGPVSIDGRDPQLGPRDARVLIVVFSDFECPFCAGAATMLKQLQADRPKTRLAFKHHPLVRHNRARALALFAQSVHFARGNDAFWRVHDRIFSSVEVPSDEVLLAWAAELGLAKYDLDAQAAWSEEKLRVDAELAERLNISATPHLFVNARSISGLPAYEALREAVDQAT
ncbi:MAG: DsbA family protein [Polyangiaceae bacterium]|nr:DsbA family protein [Polyangiaceae bacterium]